MTINLSSTVSDQCQSVKWSGVISNILNKDAMGDRCALLVPKYASFVSCVISCVSCHRVWDRVPNTLPFTSFLVLPSFWRIIKQYILGPGWSCFSSLWETGYCHLVLFLQDLCQKLHEKIGISEEERYGIEFKLNMVLNEVRRLPPQLWVFGNFHSCFWAQNVGIKPSQEFQTWARRTDSWFSCHHVSDAVTCLRLRALTDNLVN